jgi:hypothetical protein
MRTAFLAAFALAACAIAAPAAAETRNFGVNGFDRIRLDGPYKVTLTTGTAPYARATGKLRALDLVSVRVEGRTLIIRTDRSNSWGGSPSDASGPVEIKVGTHDLSAAWLNGAGQLAIDKVKGLKFQLSAQGAGSVAIGAVDVDVLDAAIAGSAGVSLSGRAAKATVVVRGSADVDGSALQVKDAVINAEGPSTITLAASNTAKVTARGVAAVTLSGAPACTLDLQGSASATGCKASRR